jgi:GNAT superfamily N-acetyltransferase
LEIEKSSDIPIFPSGLSFFDPYLEHYTREVLGVEGKVRMATSLEGILGLFLYDEYEKTGSIYTRSKKIFDYFRKLEPSSFLFAEIETSQIVREVYDVYMLNLEGVSSHSFKYEVSTPRLDEIERFMRFTHPGVNSSWPRVALNNGDKCFIVKLDGKCAGCAWVSLVDGIGRLHTLYVNPQYRRMGIGEDLLYARLLWLKFKGARLAFSEISEDNVASAMVARKAKMFSCGRLYMYMT